VSFVSYLGNAIAAENAVAGAQWTALESYNEERGRLGIEAWHHTPGDHDLGCFGSAQIASALMPCRTGGTFYYSFNACPGWRVLVLDSYDMSLLAHTPGSAAHTATLAYLQANNPNPLSAADPLEGLEGPDRRWGPSCGGLGETQLMWLGAQLSVAAATGERCIIMTRLGVLPEACDGEHLLFNFDAVQEKIDAQPGVVALILFAGDGRGAYGRDGRGVHHLAPHAAISCDVNEDAFGALQVFEHTIRLDMAGCPPDLLRRPQGWPSELNLQRGGALVTSDGSGLDLWKMSAAFFSIWWYIIQTVMVPMQPVFRMITTKPPDVDDDAPTVATSAPASTGGSSGGSKPVDLGVVDEV